jgi:hypothetical protein
MNVEIGAEAALLQEKEFLSGIFVAVNVFLYSFWFYLIVSPLLRDITVSYRQTPIFRHPFLRKQCFSLKYSLVSPPQNFWRYV